VLVDLYPLVRKSIHVGAESCSLKALEPLYKGATLRSGEVTTAAADSPTCRTDACILIAHALGVGDGTKPPDRLVSWASRIKRLLPTPRP
jgi:hypothetical protein